MSAVLMRAAITFILLMLAEIDAVASPSCPSEIHAIIPHVNASEPAPAYHRIVDVHTALSSCSNITALNLRIAVPGLERWPGRWSFPLDQTGASRYPSALTSLSLERYKLDEWDWEDVLPPWEYPGPLLQWAKSRASWNWLRWRWLPAEQRAKKNLDLWLDAMDFSQIRTLQLKDSDTPYDYVTPRLAPRLHGLRSLHVVGTKAVDFILALPPNSLESLSWIYSGDNGASLERVLEQQGHSLTNLEWRTPESDFEARPVLSLDRLRKLGTQAPYLRNFTIDMNRNGSWPWDELRTLSRNLPALTHLSLYLEIESECQRSKAMSWLSPCDEYCVRGEQYAHPLLTVAAAREMFSLLRAEKAGAELKTTDFYVGDWKRWEGPSFWAPWLERRKGLIKCMLANKGDDLSCEGEDTVIPEDEAIRPDWCDDANTVKFGEMGAGPDQP
jgi:hypothetical protein